MSEIITSVLILLVVLGLGYCGWWLARIGAVRLSKKYNQKVNNQYFQGLNYLLNEQPDKAIQVFLELAEVNQDTVETHLALGSLFRRRGEVDRAIRIHQNIIAKPSLSETQRTMALLELGEDYMRAGLLDRAERLFAELIDKDTHAPTALRHLLDIYQQEKDWEKAIEQAQKLERVTGEYMGQIMAQFCCELSEQSITNGNLEEARRHLRQARRHDPQNIRARFILARLAEQKQDFKAAVKTYEEIAGLDLDYLPELLNPYLRCADAAGYHQQAMEQLEEWAKQYRGVSLVLTMSTMLEADQGSEAAAQYLADQLAERPSIRGLDRLIKYNAEGKGAEDPNNMILKAIAERLLSDQPDYRCTNCGFSGQSHHWQCPSCKQWGTTKIIRGVLGE